MKNPNFFGARGLLNGCLFSTLLWAGVICLLILLSGCESMTPRERQTAWIVGGVVVAGALIAVASDSDTPGPMCQRYFVVGPNGAYEVCR